MKINRIKLPGIAVDVFETVRQFLIGFDSFRRFRFSSCRISITFNMIPK